MRNCLTPGCPGTDGSGRCLCGCVDSSPEMECPNCGNSHHSSMMEWGGNYPFCEDDEFFCNEECVKNMQIKRCLEDGENPEDHGLIEGGDL